ncbi:hypothetical protein HOLleu_19924 [Holothuria leucospilota]|uniref:Uncharacterized protein n=1 Tax=Holothuria leucospilota TaxID=206669 RepID=A0A9Q1H7K6_HOLLE|nr:hypothetical protein HOLleu_19924 [Holothuria leucospilota]
MYTTCAAMRFQPEHANGTSHTNHTGRFTWSKRLQTITLQVLSKTDIAPRLSVSLNHGRCGIMNFNFNLPDDGTLFTYNNLIAYVSLVRTCWQRLHFLLI